MPFLPEEFVVPQLLETEHFRLRPITVNDVVKDYDAVMSSQEHLWHMFGNVWGWPPPDLTLAQDLIDLGWHQKEFQLRSSFDYAVMSLDESHLLGCVYVNPPSKPAFDAEVCFWVRRSALADGLDEVLAGTVKEWMASTWPFESVAYPGREIGWDELDALPNMAPSPVRVIAICLFTNEDRLLVSEGYDTVKETPYYRPLGGGVDPGETSTETIRREIREEIGQEITDLRLLDVSENIFTVDDRAGHEIVFVYDGAFVDTSVYARDSIIVHLDNGDTATAVWRSLDSFDEYHRLVPEALMALLLDRQNEGA